MLVFSSGLMAAFALAPYFWWWLFAIGFSLFYMVLSGRKTALACAGYSWLFAFGYFVGGLHWIGNALLVEGNPYAWAWPLAVTALPAGLALFWAIAGWIVAKGPPRNSFAGYLFTICIFALAEWARGTLLTGFPWNLPGYIWGNTLEIVQITTFSDIFMLSLLTLLWAGLAGFILQRPAPSRKSVVQAVLLVVISVSLTYGFGAWHLNAAETQTKADTFLHVVQPNIPQHEKWDPRFMVDNYQTLLSLTREAAENNSAENNDVKTHLIIWPETSLSPWLLSSPAAMLELKQTLATFSGDVYLLAGALIRHKDDTLTNSLLVFDKIADEVARYDKHHLVPFGEYIPFQDWIPLEPVTQFKGFIPGTGPKHITINPDMQISPLVCYEAIFPYKTVRHIPPAHDAPDLLINVTNDAWYGDSAGPYQHLTQSVFRAVEHNIPLVRAANTGISTVVDAYGRKKVRSNLFSSTVLSTPMPQGVEYFSTIAVIRSYFFLVVVVGIVLFLSYLRMQQRQKIE